MSLHTTPQSESAIASQAPVRSESALDGALAKTRTPHVTYLASTPLERRLLDQTFFKRILVRDDGTIEELS